MNERRKITYTAVFIVFAFLIFASPLPVYAWTVNITTEACAAPGDTVTVPVIAYNVTSAVPDIATANYNIEFDASVVNVTGVVTGSGNALSVSNWNFIANNIVRILAWDTTAGHTGDVNIANVTFEAVGSAGSSSTLGICDAQFTDYDINTVTPNAINNGTFTILGGPTPTPTPTPTAPPAPAGGGGGGGAPTDSDGDGLSDFDEKVMYKTDPYKADTDNGGVNDGAEIIRGTDPLDPTDDIVSTPTPSPTPQVAPNVSPSVTPPPTPTPSPPGFEAFFAIAGVLAVAYLVMRRRIA